MLSATVSAIALVMAIGPHLHVSLQAAIDEAQPVTETAVEETALDESVPELPETAPEDDSAPLSMPLESDPIAEAVEAVSDPVDPVAETILTAEPETAEPTPVTSNQVAEAEWPAILDQVSAALSAARTAKGNFVQTNADGSITSGTFALNRPGRMRFDYDDPTPILIVSNGTTVAMEDSELETVDRVPIGSTPLGLILSTDLRFDEDVEVLSILQNADRVGVRVSDATGELEGTLTMVLDATSYDLQGWLATDGNLQTTVVDLFDVEKNVRLDPRLFRLDDAEDEEDER
ncbi:MAG: outer-membrane lipoprotein carrier protein LolA [Henriciella sp.]|nr:outer-membrane lipoprotein carrier protein LolA [Henriciella sp.]